MDRTLFTHRDYLIECAGNLDTAADRGDMEAIDRIGAELMRVLALRGPFGIIVTSECDGCVIDIRKSLTRSVDDVFWCHTWPVSALGSMYASVVVRPRCLLTSGTKADPEPSGAVYDYSGIGVNHYAQACHVQGH